MCCGALRLLLGDQLLLEEARDRVPVPLAPGVRGLGLGQLRLRRRQLALGLADAALGVHLRLVHAELALPELLVEHGDLVPGQLHARLGLPHRGRRLLLAGADLLVVEQGEDLAGLDAIALAHGDLADAARGLGGDRRVVALDAPAHRDHARRQVGRSQHEAPGREPAEASTSRSDEDPEPARPGVMGGASGSRQRAAPGRVGRASPWMSRSCMCST